MSYLLLHEDFLCKCISSFADCFLQWCPFMAFTKYQMMYGDKYLIRQVLPGQKFTFQVDHGDFPLLYQIQRELTQMKDLLALNPCLLISAMSVELEIWSPGTYSTIFQISNTITLCSEFVVLDLPRYVQVHRYTSMEISPKQINSCTQFREITLFLKQKSMRMYIENVCSNTFYH